jgi:hypothetical protein
MKDTTQQLCRNAFDEQFGDDMLAQLAERVQRAIGRLESRTRWRDNRGLDDRINGAVMKTLDGTRAWEPSRCALIDFLFQAIRSDVSAEIEHLASFPEATLDDPRVKLAPVEEQTIKALEETRSTPHAAAAGFFSVIITELRELARKDKSVLKLLEQYDAGIFDRREIMARAKWSPRRYGTVYQRLMRMAQQIDEELRGTVVDALAN